jgi:hypothetical protein
MDLILIILILLAVFGYRRYVRFAWSTASRPRSVLSAVQPPSGPRAVS